MNPWVAPIAALAGVVLGSIATGLLGWLQFRRELWRDTRRHRLARLEELHEVLTEIDYTTRTMSSKSIVLLAEGVAVQNIMEITQNEPPIPFERMVMLAQIYASELEPAISDVLTSKERFGNVWVEAAKCASSPDKAARERAYDEVRKAELEMRSRLDGARFVIARLARTLA